MISSGRLSDKSKYNICGWCGDIGHTLGNCSESKREKDRPSNNCHCGKKCKECK